MGKMVGKAFQSEETASAKALGQEGFHVWGMARWSPFSLPDCLPGERGWLSTGGRERRQPSLGNSSPVVPQWVGGTGVTDIHGQVTDLVHPKEVFSEITPGRDQRPEPMVRAQHDSLATHIHPRLMYLETLKSAPPPSPQPLAQTLPFPAWTGALTPAAPIQGC